jgi:transcription initiation factor IIE alpha subunit
MERDPSSLYPDVRVFGSALRTAVLVAVELLEMTHLAELARVLGVNHSAIQRVLRSLERDGLIAIRTAGRERRVSINTTYFASTELRALLRKIGDSIPDYPRMLAAIRRRPRRTGK